MQFYVYKVNENLYFCLIKNIILFMSKGWTEERRKQQAERCRRNKPWEKSTGPKTSAGKQRSKRNAIKHGRRSLAWKQIRLLCKVNSDFLWLARHLILAENAELCKTIELIKKRRESAR